LIVEITGDLLKSQCDIRCQQVNCQGIMGSGLALSIKEKYPEVFESYKIKCQKYGSDMLGEVLFIKCKDGTTVANLFAQDKYGYNGVYTDYNAFERCIRDLYFEAFETDQSVAFPYNIGCDRGGGDWEIIYGIIQKYFKDSQVMCQIIKLGSNVKW